MRFVVKCCCAVAGFSPAGTVFLQKTAGRMTRRLTRRPWLKLSSVPESEMPAHSLAGKSLLAWTCACLCGFAGVAHSSQPAKDTRQPAADPARRWAVIFQGLPGDAEHARKFQTVTDELQTWLTESLEFPEEQVLRLPETSAADAEQTPALTADLIRTTLDSLAAKLQPEDALWIFTVGHGSHDGKRAWFHVAGRDPSDVDFAGWMSGVRCREQVLWLTHSSSGWMVKPLSRPGRIIIAATAADDEPNETEFPHALVSITRKSPPELDRSGDGALSIAEFYTAVVAEVERRYKKDNRLATEHAQLDDNGDGQGSEAVDEPMAAEPAAAKKPKRDGDLSRATPVPDCRLRRDTVPPEQPSPAN